MSFILPFNRGHLVLDISLYSARNHLFFQLINEKTKNYGPRIRHLVSGLIQSGHKLEKQRWHRNLLIWDFFDAIVFLFSRSDSAPSLLLVVENWKKNNVWTLSNIRGLEWVRITKFEMSISKEKLGLKYQGLLQKDRT